MNDRAIWDLERVWDELARRFDRETVSFYRKLSESPTEGFEEAKDHFRDQVAALSGSEHDINRSEAKGRLILAHVILAIFDALRRGETEWKPLPPPQANWETEETELLLWAALHGMSDDRWSRVRREVFGTEA